MISPQRCLLSFTISAGVLKRRSMRLKHRSHLECVSGLTQHALWVDVYAKVLADNLGSLLGGNSHAEVPDRNQPRPKYHVKPHPSLAYKG